MYIKYSLFITALIIMLIISSSCSSQPNIIQNDNINSYNDYNNNDYNNENNSSEPNNVNNDANAVTDNNLTYYDVAQIGEFHDGIAKFAVRQGLSKVSGYTFFDENGDKVNYDGERLFYGYVDINGNVLIKPQYLYAQDMIDGYACVMIADDKKDGMVTQLNWHNALIDINNNIIFEEGGDISEIGFIHNGYFYVIESEGTADGLITSAFYYDTDLNLICKHNNCNKTSLVNEFGYAVIETIDTEEDFVINIINGDSWLCENKNLNKVVGQIACFKKGVDIAYAVMENGNNQLTVIEDGKDNLFYMNGYYLDDEGKIFNQSFDEVLIDLESIGDFNNMLLIDYCISEDGFISVILSASSSLYSAVIDLNKSNQNAVFSMPVTNDIDISEWSDFTMMGGTWDDGAIMFTEGLCPAKDAESGLYGYIDTTGKWIIEPIYYEATSFYNGYATVNGNTIIDKNSQIILTSLN